MARKGAGKGIPFPAPSYSINMNAWQLERGRCAVIKDVRLSGSAAARLHSLGFVRGQKVTAAGRSLLDGSVLLTCGAVRLAVRRSVAEGIEVEG